MNDDFNLCCPVPLSDYATVQLAHGGGGRLMRNLIEGFSAGLWCDRGSLSPLLSPLSSLSPPLASP